MQGWSFCFICPNGATTSKPSKTQAQPSLNDEFSFYLFLYGGGGVSCNERGLLRILEAEKAKGMMN